MGYRCWTNKELEDAVKVSFTKTDVKKFLNQEATNKYCMGL